MMLADPSFLITEPIDELDQFQVTPDGSEG
jgi:hypothetical protein